VKRGKTDAADAAAICEAVTRPTMRFVAIKTPDQQALLSQHRARQLMIGQRTQLSNMIRGLIGEFGCIVAKGLNHITAFAEALQSGEGPSLLATAQDVIVSLCEQLLALHQRIRMLEKKIFAASRKDARVRLLETIPGIGPVTASGRLRPRRLSRRLEHPISSGPGARLPLGWASPRSTDRAGARNALAGYRKWATGICVGCSSPA
jgi:transposase